MLYAKWWTCAAVVDRLEMMMLLMLQVFHKIITTGHQRLQPLFDCLLTIVVNGNQFQFSHLVYLCEWWFTVTTLVTSGEVCHGTRRKLRQWLNKVFCHWSHDVTECSDVCRHLTAGSAACSSGHFVLCYTNVHFVQMSFCDTWRLYDLLAISMVYLQCSDTVD